MSEATTTHNLDRVIAYSLTGPVYAPDWMSDEEVSAFYRLPSARDHGPTARAPAAGFPGPLWSEGKCCHRCGALPGMHLQGQSAARKSQYRSALRAIDCVKAVARLLKRDFQPKKSERIASYRISMVVVAIAMVVGLRGLVNLLSQHTRTDGGA